MTGLDLSSVAWRKSTRSGGGEGTCVEVAAAWRKSTRSGGSGETCVEVAASAGQVVAMRDSKDPDGAVLCFTRPEWSDFLGRVKAGALD
ncbi:DUF397 domain-containing protein [Actinomadura alba]|uniref:DUF397 domain-containing protein n=1 Tax=Actinomadura alba TaxID=406431 RepID=A0ABR7M1K4_9ACTN|nr:DUF397 domain-containing protein [Actinomadura alba]MBC6470669.1 DUF397 domain-containing protein [Actinomadura alba]